MALVQANTNFSTLVATTLKNYRPKLADNITNHQVLVWMLKQLGFVEEKDGGETLVEPLLHGENTTVGSYSGYDLISTVPQTGISAAEFEWKQIAGTFSISGREEFQNSGSKTQVISLVTSKIQQLELSMKLEVNEQVFGDGTGNGGKDITGLELAVENGAAWSTYGGIDSNTYSFWRNAYLAEGGALDLASMRNVFNSASRSKSTPKLLICPQDVYEDYEALALANNDITRTDSKLGDAGFQNLLFKGVPLVFDEDCTADSMYFLNPEHLRFCIGRGRNFVTTPTQKPDNQDARLSQVLLYCNFTCNDRRRQGVLTGIS